jgi:hypothetical protein
VIEGFLDVLLPVEETETKRSENPNESTGDVPRLSRRQPPATSKTRALFTVKPGGIAGYLGRFDISPVKYDVTQV